MTDSKEYTPPKVWTWDKEKATGPFAKINRPIAGPTHEKDLPVGRHPIQLYSIGTPNGNKVPILLEELLAAGHSGAEYDAWLVDVFAGEQFSSGFVKVNPNSKIPAMIDRSGPEPIRVFESGSILLYLADKFKEFIPDDMQGRAECISWVFWQCSLSPYIGGGLNHFLLHAPTKSEYAIDRYAMEVKRQLDVLNRRLDETRYLVGESYTIADIASWVLYGQMVMGYAAPGVPEFLSVHEYTNVKRWAEEIFERSPVRRGRMVNKTLHAPLNEQLHERHDASDFELRTQDKLEVQD